jgi:LysM repeat protein
MSQLTIYLLLIGALALPVAGALVLRLVGRWLSTPLLYGAAAVVVLGAAACALLLARQHSQALQIGGLVVIQPIGLEPDGDGANGEPHEEELAPTPAPTSVAPSPSATSTPSPSPTRTQTSRPSPTPEPTETATPEPTETATSEPTEEEEEDETTIYVVESGDTIRSIANAYGVSVEAIMEANDLSASEADNLQVGQELIIP